MKQTYSIACIPGDGIGAAVLSQAQLVLERAAELFDFRMEWIHFPWSCEYYSRTGAMMPADGLDKLRKHDAIFLGAVGYPGVPDHESLWGLLLPIRREFEQYVNLRPIRLMPGVRSPLADMSPGMIDYLIVRENTEGEYSDYGELLAEGSNDEIVVQHSVFTRKGVGRIFRYAFELARQRKGKLTSVTKLNGIALAMPYWDSRGIVIAREYPDVELESFHVDILAAHLVQKPNRFDVLVASNLMGDILSDLGAGCAGTIGIAPSANLNPEGTYPSMFEPVHGSAPDIAGRNIADPIGQVWSGAMMLDHLGEAAAAQAIVAAIEKVVVQGPCTPDLGGNATTPEVGRA